MSGSARRGPLYVVTLVALAVALAVPHRAAAAPTASLAAGFSPGTRLAEGTMLSAEAEFVGTEYHGRPLPLTELSIVTPKGTALSDEGLPTCAGSVLEPSGRGPFGCPFGSRVGGEGSFAGNVSFGKEQVPEGGSAEVFFAPGGGVWLYLFGHEPVLVEVLAHGEYTPPSGGKGPGVTFQLPLIETVPGAALMTIGKLELSLGGFHEHESTMSAGVTSPPECTTVLGWGLAAKFSDGEGGEAAAEAETTSPCPGAGKREATTTRLELSSPTVEQGQPEIVTAKVAPVSPSGFLPGGNVALGLESFSCMNALVPVTGPGSEGACEAESFTVGTHAAEGIYLGDEHFAPSQAEPLSVSVTAALSEEELAERRRAEEAARRKHEEEAATLRKHEEEEAAARRRAQEAKAKEEAERRAREAFAGAVRGLPSLIAPRGRGARIGTLLAHGGYSASISLPAGVTVTVLWFASATNGGHPTLLAKGSSTGPAGRTLLVRLTAAGRRWLRHRGAAWITVRGTLAAAGERTTTRAGGFKLRR